MASVEQLLANALGADAAAPLIGKAAETTQKSASSDEGFDVASFVETIGKTAGALEKAAENLPTSPALVQQQLAMLDNPMGITREVVHNQSAEFVAQVLPEAMTTQRVPQGIDQIKVASEESFFTKRLAARMRG